MMYSSNKSMVKISIAGKKVKKAKLFNENLILKRSFNVFLFRIK